MKISEYLKSPFSVSGLISLAVGLLLLIYPGFTNLALCYILSGALIISSAAGLLARYRRSGARLMPYEVIYHLAGVALGIFIAVRSEVIISIIPFFFGLFLLLSGISSLQKAMLLRQLEYRRRNVNIALAAVKIVLAVFIVLNPFSTAITLTRFIGACLIYDGASSLASVMRLIKARRDADRARQELRDLNLGKRKPGGDIPTVDAEFVDIVQQVTDADEE